MIVARIVDLHAPVTENVHSVSLFLCKYFAMVIMDFNATNFRLLHGLYIYCTCTCGRHGGCIVLQNSAWIEKDLDRVGPTMSNKSIETLKSKFYLWSVPTPSLWNNVNFPMCISKTALFTPQYLHNIELRRQGIS